MNGETESFNVLNKTNGLLNSPHFLFEVQNESITVYFK